MVADNVEEVASIIRCVADEMLSQNGHQLTGTECITIDPTQVLINMHELLGIIH